MKHLFILILFTILSISTVFGQRIDNLASLRAISSENYLRFHYDNDLFMGMDENYTQGMHLEFVAPCLKNNPVNFLFFKPKSDEVYYGLALEHNSFTPNKYFLPEIQFGDRPFAASLVVKSFMISKNELNRSRFSSSFTLGFIGSATGGKGMQLFIHDVVNSAEPLGWDNQIQNDVIINYGFGYEKQLYRFRNLFSIQAETRGELGSNYTNASLGVNTAFGILNSPFSSIKESSAFNLYLYVQPLLNIIGYDATLQGGLFNKNSPYTISSGSIERLTGQLNYGLVLKTKSLYFEIFGAVISKEFDTGGVARWGGVRVGVVL